MTKTCNECNEKIKEFNGFYQFEAVRYEGYGKEIEQPNGVLKRDYPEVHVTHSTGTKTVCDRCFELHYPSVHNRILPVNFLEAEDG